MRNITKTILKNRIILLILGLQICGALTFATVNPKYLYGTEDNLFYFWRYGAFSLFGIIGGIICYFIPFESMNKYLKNTVKWTIVTIVSLSAAIFLFHLFFYYSDGLVLKESTQAWLDPKAYINSSGYLIMKNMKIREMAQLFGGHNIGFDKLFANESILSYIIGTLGWILFGVVIFLSVALAYNMFIQGMKIKMPLCRFIAIATWVYIVFSFLWNSMMIFNLIPFAEIHFPFLSYDRFSLVFDLCLMGIFVRMTTLEN